MMKSGRGEAYLQEKFKVDLSIEINWCKEIFLDNNISVVKVTT